MALIAFVGRLGANLAVAEPATIRTGTGAFQIIAQRASPPVIKPEGQLTVIREQSVWATIWGVYSAYFGKDSSLPVVDFEREMVAVVDIGQRNTGGFEVNVTGMQVQEERVNVFYEERQPGLNCYVTFALTEPFQIIKLPRIDKEVVFIGSVQRRECPDGR